MSRVAIVMIYPQVFGFQEIGNDTYSQSTFHELYLPIELLMNPATFPFNTSSSWLTFFFTYIAYFINRWFVWHILLNSATNSCFPTNGSNSSSALAASMAYRPHSMWGCVDTLTFHILSQNVKGLSFGMGPMRHCPWCLFVWTVSTDTCWLETELLSPLLRSGRVAEITDFNIVAAAASRIGLYVSYTFHSNKVRQLH